MTIRLLSAVLIAGVHYSVDGNTLSLAPSLEADLVAQGKAVYSTAPAQESKFYDFVNELSKSGLSGKFSPARNLGVVINPLTAATNIAWSGTSGATGGVDQTFPGVDGENTLWIECPVASGGVGYARAILTQNHRFASTDSVSMRIKVEKASTLRFVQVQLVQGTVVLSNSVTSDGAIEAGEHGWYNITWKLSDFSATGGSADYGSDFTSFRWQIGAGGSGGAIGKIAVSKFMKNASSAGYVIFSQDSGYDDAWTARHIFAATGIPLTIYANAALLDQATYLSKRQALELARHPSAAFEFGSYPDYKPSLSHTASGVCASQAVAGAGNLTLNGSLCSGGVATLGGARKLVLSGTAVSRTIMFTITGKLNGVAVSETMLGPAYAAGLVESANYYDQVTQIAASGAITGTLTVGTSYTVDELVENIRANAKGLASAGLGGNESHMAFAGGQTSAPLFAAAREAGVFTGRTTYHSQTGPRNHLVHDAAFNPWLLSGVNLGTAIATLKSMVDDIKARGGVLVFYFHHLAASVDGVNPTIEQLAELVAYCKAFEEQGFIRCIKPSTLRALLQTRTAV